MIENVIAQRYAKGLADLAADKGEIDKVRTDLDSLADLLDPERGEISVPELTAFLGSPTVPVADKVKLTDVLCEKLEIGETVSNFLNVLIHRSRVMLAGRIASCYDDIASEYDKTLSAVVESASPLSASQEEALKTTLSSSADTPVRLSVRVTPSLIAGLRVRIGDTVFDGTVQNRLKRFESSLK